MKRIKNILIVVVFISLAVWLFIKMKSLPSISDILSPKKITIQNTPVVVKQIQALAQLVTVSMYEEIVVDSNVSDTKKVDIPLLPEISIGNEERTLVLVGKVTAQVGIDMQKMSDNDVSGTKDSIHISLPPAEVLDAIVNSSDVSIFIERGDWNNEAVIRLKSKIQYIAIADAQSRGLLLQSENKARQILIDFFTAAGYKKVVIRFQSKTQMQGRD